MASSKADTAGWLAHQWDRLMMAAIGAMMIAQFSSCRPRLPPDASSAVRLLRAQKHQQAMSLLTPLIDDYPDSIRWLRLRGFAFDELGDYRAGIKDFSELLKHKPSDVLTLNNRGYALYHNGQVEEAVADYSHALMIDPAFMPARCNRVLAFVALGRYAQALADANIAIKSGITSNSSLYNLQGYCLMQLSQPKLAVQAFDKAGELEPNYADAYINREQAIRAMSGK